MKKKKNIWIRPALLFSLSAVLLLLSTVGSTRAALTYYSADYAVQVEIKSIGVSLLENNRIVSYRNYAETGSNEFVEGGTGLLKNESGESDRFGAGEGQEKLIPGKMYDEKLSVQNTGAIDEYVRVVVTRSWQDADGKKATDLDPGLIGLSLDGMNVPSCITRIRLPPRRRRLRSAIRCVLTGLCWMNMKQSQRRNQAS